MRLPRGTNKYFEDQTRLPIHEQRKLDWLSQQPTSETGLGFVEKMMRGAGMSTTDLYLLRAKLFGRAPIPDFKAMR